MMPLKTKLLAGRIKVDAEIETIKDRLYLRFPYSADLLQVVKSLKGAKWHGYEEIPDKRWSIEDCPRNRFQLLYLMGQNPYAKFDLTTVDDYTPVRPLYSHQVDMVKHGLAVKTVLWAAEMGTGKSLAAIELMEYLKNKYPDYKFWYIGPRSAIVSFERELIKWQSKVYPKILSYEELVKTINSWTPGQPAPNCVIFDESSKIKTPQAQRSQAAQYLTDNMRKEHGDNAYIILMSGTPAPKSPVDWWQQCEVACPGFIREGDIHKFRNGLALIQKKESITGGIYPEIVTWWDDSNKCSKCGQPKDHTDHSTSAIDDKTHTFVPSVNQIERLYKRLKGLVLIKLKKDCLDLPEKRYELIRVVPTPETLRLAKLITKTSKRSIEALTLLRELSDGFQYKETKTGTIPCSNCSGTGKALGPIPNQPSPDPLKPQTDYGATFTNTICECCGGLGTIDTFERNEEVFSSPKDTEFKKLLDEHEEVGRFIVWGGFTATIDRLVEMAHAEGWTTLRVDGRGYLGQQPNNTLVDKDTLLNAMDLSNKAYKELLELYPKVCFVGNPMAGGMGLTLTASPSELFYSNSFDGTARMQSEDRAHRMGMDSQRGLTIYDLIHLPSDLLVLENLKNKRRLQDITLGEINKYMETPNA